MAVAEQFGRSPEQVTVGCGTCELLYLLAHATLQRGDEVVLAAPSLTSYRDVIDIRGAVPVAGRSGTTRTIWRPWRRR